LCLLKSNVEKFNFENECYYLVATEAFIQQIEQFLIIGYENLPMVATPNPWINGSNGGFLTNRSNNLLHFSARMEHRAEVSQPYLDAVNRLNQVGFRVNRELLQFFKTESGHAVLNHYLNSGIKEQQKGTQI
jgi:DNA-directed RNA polymerase